MSVIKKQFNKKIYSFHNEFDSRAEARLVASQLRREGFRVRVNKSVDSWTVWTRDKERVVNGQ